MSHPISEAAGYFAKKSDSISNKSNTTLGLAVPQPALSVDDPLSPASPESRQPHRFRQQQQQQQQQEQQQEDVFDPRAQWQRMLNKISFNGVDDSPRARFQQAFQPKPKHSDQTDENNNNDSDDDDNSDSERPIELSMLEPRFGRPRRRHPQDDDATLPTPKELEDEGIITHTESNINLSADAASHGISSSNYFAHPFSPDRTSSRPPELAVPANTYSGICSNAARSNQYQPYAYPLEQGENISTSDSETDDHNTHPNNTMFDGRARLHWGKTLDKIRLIANLQKPHMAQQNPDTDASTSLVPFCSGLFDPPFVSLSKDIHGRRPVRGREEC